MLIKTKTYAKILESQGFKEEALKIYELLLKENKNNKEIIEAIQRLKTRKKFDGVNIIKLKEFNEINEEKRYEFEKWLSEI
ncbi:MAG TPA: tetratricopeptide repeat-containing protein [Nautiliaceae bacterium]|nr:tetratricopeptide repeat-containing protein [Nautiliaceae bacterium]